MSTLNDDLSTANGNKFSAFDNDVTFSSCVSTNKMPFWNSNSCGNVNPLGVYGSAVSKQGIYWDSLTGCCSSLTQISFAVRLSHCTAGSSSQSSAKSFFWPRSMRWVIQQRTKAFSCPLTARLLTSSPSNRFEWPTTARLPTLSAGHSARRVFP